MAIHLRHKHLILNQSNSVTVSLYASIHVLGLYIIVEMCLRYKYFMGKFLADPHNAITNNSSPLLNSNVFVVIKY